MSGTSLRAGWTAAGVLLALLATDRAFAHKVNIFASVGGDAIVGECYFSGGGRVKDFTVTLLDGTGRAVGETLTDAEGRFRFDAPTRGAYRVVVDTGDGHRAEFAIRADELPEKPPGEPSARGDAAAAPSPAARPAPEYAPTDLDRIVSKAVAKQLRPLREQIARYEQRTRLRDILGGIGYIFGLAGVALYFKCGRRSATTTSDS